MPVIPDIGACRVCDQPIRFVRLANGRRIPVEIDPDPSGRLATSSEDATGHVGGAFLLPGETGASRTRWRPHSDVCRQRKGRHAPPPELMAQIRADIRAARERHEQEAAKWAARG